MAAEKRALLPLKGTSSGSETVHLATSFLCLPEHACFDHTRCAPDIKTVYFFDNHAHINVLVLVTTAAIFNSQVGAVVFLGTSHARMLSYIRARAASFCILRRVGVAPQLPPFLNAGGAFLLFSYTEISGGGAHCAGRAKDGEDRLDWVAAHP